MSTLGSVDNAELSAPVTDAAPQGKAAARSQPHAPSTSKPTSGFSRGGKRPNQGRRGGPPKRPRFTQTQGSTPTVSYDKAGPSTTSLRTFTTQRVYQVFCSNQQVTALCEAVFGAMQGRDARMAVTALQLEYVTTLCYINRLLTQGIELGYYVAEAASLLRNATKGIQIPGVLCKYIESLGSVQMDASTRIVPWVGARNAMFARDSPNISPADILRRAGRPIPHNTWWIDVDWIVEWNNNTTRPSRVGMQFATPSYVGEGSSTILVSRRNLPPLVDNLPTIQGASPVGLLDAEAILGAIYAWRDLGEVYPWGQQAILGMSQYHSTEFNPSLEWNEIIIRSFTESK